MTAGNDTPAAPEPASGEPPSFLGEAGAALGALLRLADDLEGGDGIMRSAARIIRGSVDDVRRDLGDRITAARAEAERYRRALEEIVAEMPDVCACSPEYTGRKLRDPSCAYCDYGKWVTNIARAALAGEGT